MRAVMALLIFLSTGLCAVRAQQASQADEVTQGHRLAVEICSICHLAAPDQTHQPMLKPPGPPFTSIAQRPDISAQSLTKFITTTHRGLDNPAGMPNPDLADYQVKEVVAYILSLRK